jgi:Dihydroorotase and related cyclic amidohydrolases
MSDFDLLVHTPEFSLGVLDGLVAASGPSLAGVAKEVLEVPDGRIVPGWIDAHVHFNEPGRTEWEGLETGSLALAAAGGTTFFDMPLNSTPPVVDAASLEKKRLLAGEKAHLDFALWGGLTPDSLAHLEAMAEGGAVGFKAFMCHSGLDEYPFADAATLRRGMKIAAGLNLPVSVHAEISRDLPRAGHDMAAWLASRPQSFEQVAIRLALDLAGETGCALHIVHVTCPEGIDLVTRAKQQGVDVTVETCPHYLLLDEEDAIAIGAPAKCAPPLRPAETVARMWEKLRAGEIDTLGSDHSPSSPRSENRRRFVCDLGRHRWNPTWLPTAARPGT